MPFEIILLVFAFVIVFPLAVYAFYLTRQVKQRKQRLADHEQQVAEKLAENHQQAIKSVMVVLSAYEQGKMTMTELAIRVKMLAKAMYGDSQELQDVQPLLALAEDAAHIPFLDQWQSLNNLQKMRYNQEREILEEKHQAAVNKALAKMQGQELSEEQQPVEENSAAGVAYFDPKQH